MKMKYNLVGDKYKPNIKFDIETGVLEILGYAVLESDKEYNQIKKWFDEYLSKNKNTFSVIFKIKYLNSLAVKLFTKLIIRIREKIPLDNLHVEWYYYDEDILENVEDIEFITNVNIKKIANFEY